MFKIINKYKQLFEYGAIGVFCTSINLILFWILSILQCSYLVSNTISYIIAAALNYYLNKVWCFHKNKSCKDDMIKFIVLRGGSLLLDNLILFICVTILRMPLYGSRIGLTLISILVTYIFMKKWVFV